MIVSLKEIKEYLPVDFEDEDALLEGLLQTAQQLCMDVARMADEASFSQDMVQAKSYMRRPTCTNTGRRPTTTNLC